MSPLDSFAAVAAFAVEVLGVVGWHEATDLVALVDDELEDDSDELPPDEQAARRMRGAAARARRRRFMG